MKALVLCGLLSFACVPAWSAGEPDWIKAEPVIEDDGRLFVVGIGQSMDGAVANALAQAARLYSQYEAVQAKERAIKDGPRPALSEEEAKPSQTLKQFSKRAFGAISVSTLMVDKVLGPDGTGQSIEETTQVSLEKDGSKLRIRYNMTSATKADKTFKEHSTFELDAEGTKTPLLQDELAAQGYTLKEWRDPDDHTQFVALEHAAKKTGGGKK